MDSRTPLGLLGSRPVEDGVLGPGDGGGNQKRLDLGRGISKTWGEGRGTPSAAVSTEGKLRPQQTWASVSRLSALGGPQLWGLPVKERVEMAGG